MPIEALDDDVLLIIFDILAFLDYPTRSGRLGWIRLTHVDHRWRALLLDQPTLWGRIICSLNSRTAYRVILDRAHDAPLSLNIDMDWVEKHTTVEEFATLLPRARDILAASPSGSGRIPLTGRKLPLLEEAALFSCYSFESALIAPSLRRLTICALPCTISAPGLRELALHLSAQEADPNDLLDLLATTPALEYFTLYLSKYRRRPPRHGDDPAPLSYEGELGDILVALEHGKLRIAMPNLKSIDMSHCNAVLVQVLWRSLVVPRTTSVNLAFIKYHATLAAAEPIHAYLSYHECDTLTITVSFYDEEFICYLSGTDSDTAGSCTVTIAMDLPDVLSFFSCHLGEHTRTLRLVNHISDLGLRRLLASLTIMTPAGKFAYIETLECSGLGLSELSFVLASYKFPRLRTLHLDTTLQTHDGDPVADFALVLFTREPFTKLERIILRGYVPYGTTPGTTGDIPYCDLLEVANVVIDERVLLEQPVADPSLVS